MKIRDRSFRLRSVLAAVSFAVALAVAITAVAGHSLFDDATAHPESDGATVRISALKSESGAVRVALQQEDAAGVWGERQHPVLNTVGATAKTGIWLNSSPLQLAGAQASIGPLFCVAAHGETTDPFWRRVRASARLAAEQLGLNVRFSTSLDSSAQAAEIDRCSADGAAAIASTLAAPGAISDSLLAAKAAGAKIVTFNSGAEHASSVGSNMHIALDETAAGNLAGQKFNEAGLSGVVACIIHEADNVGLEQRCDALAHAYTGGDVIRLPLDEDFDLMDSIQAITARLLDAEEPPIVGMLALNSRTLQVAMTAISQTVDQIDWTVRLGSVGLPGGPLRGIPREHIVRHYIFGMDAFAESQGYLIVAAMHLIHAQGLQTEFAGVASILTASPTLVNTRALSSNPQALAEVVRRQSEFLEWGDEWGDE